MSKRICQFCKGVIPKRANRSLSRKYCDNACYSQAMIGKAMTLDERKEHRAIQRMAQKRASRLGWRYSELDDAMKKVLYEYCKAKRQMGVTTRWW